jgi:acylglycerol lipase
MNISEIRANFDGPHHLISSVDGKTLFLREWSAIPKSKVGILILHGITAYSGPYAMIGVPLSNAGFTCYGLDLRGHGLSDGNRGDYSSKELLLQDLKATLDFLNQNHEKLIILGHSLGVVTGAIILMNMLSETDGVVFLSAAREVKEGVYKKPSFFTTLKILLSSIITPSRPVIHYYRDGIQGLDDPLFNFYYTLRFLNVLNAKKLTLPEKLDIPAYVGVGENDELFAAQAAKEFFNEINSPNKEFYIIPNAKHAEFPKGSWDHLIAWLKKNF